jgi:hypothetical protein
MASPYLDILDALDCGSWGWYSHRIIQGVRGQAGQEQAAKLGSSLWGKLREGWRLKAENQQLKLEVEGLRDSMQALTDHCLKLEQALSQGK